MPLQIYIAANVRANFDRFTYNKDQAELYISNAEGASLKIDVPFSLSKIKDRIFDPSLDIDKVFIFRNLYFKEKSVIRLKYRVGEENKSCGFIFSLRGITQPDDVVGDAKDLAMYAARVLVALLHNKGSVPAKVPPFNPSGDYRLSDFYDDDIAICVISKEQVGEYLKTLELSLLYHLNLYGFYFLNTNENKNFQPEVNKYQRVAL